MVNTQALPALSFARPSMWLRWVEKYFYLCMSLIIAAVIVYGFSGTVGHRLIHGDPPRPILLWVHAIVFSSWVVFYVLQSTLIRVHKVRFHRTLGWVGAILGASMVVIGFWVALVMARFDISRLHRSNKDAFLIVPLLDIVTFGLCLGLAILWRSRPEPHRRLMLIASCALTGAAFGRIPIMHAPLSFYGGIDGLILLGALRDLAISRRIHGVYIIAIPLLVAAQAAAAEIFMHRAAFWIRIADKLIG